MTEDRNDVPGILVCCSGCVFCCVVIPLVLLWIVLGPTKSLPIRFLDLVPEDDVSKSSGVILPLDFEHAARFSMTHAIGRSVNLTLTGQRRPCLVVLVKTNAWDGVSSCGVARLTGVDGSTGEIAFETENKQSNLDEVLQKSWEENLEPEADRRRTTGTLHDSEEDSKEEVNDEDEVESCFETEEFKYPPFLWSGGCFESVVDPWIFQYLIVHSETKTESTDLLDHDYGIGNVTITVWEMSRFRYAFVWAWNHLDQVTLFGVVIGMIAPVCLGAFLIILCLCLIPVLVVVGGVGLVIGLVKYCRRRRENKLREESRRPLYALQHSSSSHDDPYQRPVSIDTGIRKRTEGGAERRTKATRRGRRRKRRRVDLDLLTSSSSEHSEDEDHVAIKISVSPSVMDGDVARLAEAWFGSSDTEEEMREEESEEKSEEEEEKRRSGEVDDCVDSDDINSGPGVGGESDEDEKDGDVLVPVTEKEREDEKKGKDGKPNEEEEGEDPRHEEEVQEEEKKSQSGEVVAVSLVAEDERREMETTEEEKETREEEGEDPRRSKKKKRRVVDPEKWMTLRKLRNPRVLEKCPESSDPLYRPVLIDVLWFGVLAMETEKVGNKRKGGDRFLLVETIHPSRIPSPH